MQPDRHDPRDTLLTVGVTSAGAMGGVFLAFSTFVMRALDDLPPGQAIAAMQEINRRAPTPLFMVPLFGTAVLGVVLATRARRSDEPAGGWLVGGALSYLAGIVLTAAYHVPRNDDLDRVDPGAVDAAATWATFVRDWTAANHVRTLTCLAAAVCWAVALQRRARPPAADPVAAGSAPAGPLSAPTR
jgi:uncharacterized membrane protein